MFKLLKKLWQLNKQFKELSKKHPNKKNLLDDPNFGKKQQQQKDEDLDEFIEKLKKAQMKMMYDVIKNNPYNKTTESFEMDLGEVNEPPRFDENSMARSLEQAIEIEQKEAVKHAKKHMGVDISYDGNADIEKVWVYAGSEIPYHLLKGEN